MNWLGVLPIIVGIIYLTYSILHKNKIALYNGNKKIIILKEKSFLRLQLYFSIINCLYMIILGLIVIIYNLSDAYVIASPLIFHFINSLLKIISKKKKYIKIN